MPFLKLTFFLACFFVTVVQAESADEAIAKKKPNKSKTKRASDAKVTRTVSEPQNTTPYEPAQREPSSVTTVETRAEIPSQKREWRVRASLLTGYVSTASNDSTEQANRNANHFNRNVYFGTDLDFSYGKYFGSTLDAFFSAGKSGRITESDKVSGAITVRDNSMKVFGGLWDIQGHYPYDFSNDLRFLPKMGLGYGILGVSQNNPITGSNSSDGSKLGLNGLYAMLGLETLLYSRFNITADWALSLGGSGSYDITASGSTTSKDSTTAKYDRIRIGGYYEVSKPYLIGLHYIRRKLSATIPNMTAPIEEVSSQILASFSVILN